MLSASHWLLFKAWFCGRTHLPLSPNSTTPTVQVIFRYLRPDAPVFNIITVGMVTFRQSPCWYYPWADIILSISSDTQHLWTWWHFGEHTGLIIFTNPSARAGYDTRSIFKWTLTGLNSEFSFSLTSCRTKVEKPSLPYYLPIAGGRIIGFIRFPRVLVLCEMQSVRSKIWTRVAVSISCDDNRYTTGTSGLINLSVHNICRIHTRRSR